MTTRIDVTRSVLVDPSSVALLLAGPAARELWPHRGNRLVGLVGSQDPAFAVDVAPPSRSGVGFGAAVRVTAADDTVATGRLVITPDERRGCRLGLSLHADERIAQRLERDVHRYLANIATATRERSSAA